MKTRPPCRLFAAVFLLAAALSPLYGELFYRDSPEVLLLRRAYREAGKVFPYASYPVHGSDLLDLAEKLPPLPRAEDQENLDGFIRRMREEESRGGLLLRGNLAAAYEHRLRTGFTPLDEGEPKNAVDFNRAYLSQPPFLSLGAGIGAFRGILVDAQLDFRPPWNGEGDYTPDHNFMPLPTVDIGFDLMSRGVLAWNGKYLDIFLGRDNFHLGNTPGASLYPAGTLPWQDGLRLFAPLGPFSFDYLLATMAPKKGFSKDVDPNDGADREYFGFMSESGPSTTILMAVHRFQWNFGPVKAAAGGTVIYARSNNAFYMTDILPVFIYHNADMRPNNLNLVFDISWAAFRGFTLSATAGFDDISAEIFGLPDGPTPTIPAWIIQAEYGISGGGMFVDFLLEAGYTHYLWGNYAFGDEDRGWGKVPLARAIYRYAPNTTAVLLPLTSPYGPGTYWGRLASALDIPRLKLKIGADLLILSKLKEANLVDTPYGGNSALEKGPRRFYASLDLSCTWTWKNFDLSLSPALILVENKPNFECSLGLRFSLEGRKAIP